MQDFQVGGEIFKNILENETLLLLSYFEKIGIFKAGSESLPTFSFQMSNAFASISSSEIYPFTICHLTSLTFNCKRDCSPFWQASNPSKLGFEYLWCSGGR